MGVLAETYRVAEGTPLAGGGVNRARRVPQRRSSEPARRDRVTWNVLAEELVPFPPAVDARLPVAGIVPLGDSVTAPNDRATFVRSPRVAPRSRGLRRLLPGAATLAVLSGVWLGAGALSSLNRPSLTVIPGAVKVPGGYLYRARPGDTLWSIASKLQPGADPRPLVAKLQQQLHGAELMSGDQLKLP